MIMFDDSRGPRQNSQTGTKRMGLPRERQAWPRISDGKRYLLQHQILGVAVRLGLRLVRRLTGRNSGTTGTVWGRAGLGTWTRRRPNRTDARRASWCGRGTAGQSSSLATV